MKRRILIALGLVLALCLVFTTVVFGTQATKQSDITYRAIKINVNGHEIAPVDVNGNPTEPFILNSDGSTYLPVRAVADALGLGVEWDGATSTVILTSNGTEKFSDKTPAATKLTKKATLTYRDIKITLDGKKVALLNAKGEAVEPFIFNNSTYLPVRAVASALGCDIGWDNATSSISISNEAVEELRITKEPKNAVLNNYAGSKVQLSVAVTGGKAPYTYQWQFYSTKAGWVVFQNPTNQNATLVVTTDDMISSDGTKLRCEITDAAGNSVISKAVTVTPEWPLEISSQTKGTVEIEIDEIGKITVSVTGGTGEYTAKWEYAEISSVSAGTDWQTLTKRTGVLINSTGPKMILELVPEDNNFFLMDGYVRCRITDTDGNTVTSDKVRVKVKSTYVPPQEQPLRIVKQPTSISSLPAGSIGQLSVTVTGGTGNYEYTWKAYYNGRWYDLTDGSFMSFSGADTPTLRITGGIDRMVSGSAFICTIYDGKSTVNTDYAYVR